jgi:predicted small metal-binding protein
MPSFSCKDAGVDCDFKAEAKTEEKLMKKIAKHARKGHGYDPIPEEMLEKVKKAIKA